MGYKWTTIDANFDRSLQFTTGTGDGSVVVTYADNKAYQPRTGTVTFTGSNGDILTFTVEQEKKPVIVYDRPIYRSGNIVKKMYRSGELIYYRLKKDEDTTLVSDGQEPIDYGDDPPEYIDY